jgi:hypothetical protein
MDALWMASPYSAEETQGDRSFFDCGGDRLCKCSTTGRAIAPREKLRSPSCLEEKQGDRSTPKVRMFSRFDEG